ncbi:MAG: thioredoxin-like domain-containing protein, partial [Chthoniobacterales bacterium]
SKTPPSNSKPPPLRQPNSVPLESEEAAVVKNPSTSTPLLQQCRVRNGAPPALEPLMRVLLFLIITTIALTAVAAPQPLALKEISLMLRSGYSSQDVLREISQRRVIETLDPANRKSFEQFGASPELIGVLEKGEFKVDAATAEEARKAEVAAAANREQEAEKAFRNATQILREQRTRAATTAPLASTSILAALKDKLVVCHDGTVTRADPSALENKKLIAFYYSAHWCAPCRKFTPQLVDYYNRVAPQHPEFQLVFVSLDRSRYNWETYLREAKMPWLALDYDQLVNFARLKELGGDRIPSLLVIDATGRVVASSYEGDKYLGPQNALAALDSIFAGNAAGPVASAR